MCYKVRNFGTKHRDTDSVRRFGTLEPSTVIVMLQTPGEPHAQLVWDGPDLMLTQAA